MTNAREIFGDIDIYIFDQILKGRFAAPLKILDAGCGGGRNIFFFLREKFEVFGIDENPEAIASARSLAAALNPQLAPENFQIAAVEKTSFADETFDLVISSAVLHFARDETHFQQMLTEMWRVLKPNGIFFARLASSIGIENLIVPVGESRFFLPDGSERFLVNEKKLLALTENLGAHLLEPLKTTNVQNLRCMTTWILQKF